MHRQAAGYSICTGSIYEIKMPHVEAMKYSSTHECADR